MCRREILDMYVIPDTRAVGRFIVSPEYDQLSPPLERGIEHERYEMRLRPVILSVFLCGAGRIEIPERERLQSPGTRAVGEHLLDGELGVAIGIQGDERRIFLYRDLLRFTVYGRGRRE